MDAQNLAHIRALLRPTHRARIGLLLDELGAAARVREVWLFDAAATDRGQRLTFGPAESETPIWSPDGRWVAYYRVFEGQRDIWIAPIARASWIPGISSRVSSVGRKPSAGWFIVCTNCWAAMKVTAETEP